MTLPLFGLLLITFMGGGAAGVLIMAMLCATKVKSCREQIEFLNQQQMQRLIDGEENR